MSLPNTPEGVLKIRLHHEIAADTNIRPAFDMKYSGGPPPTDDLTLVAAAVSTAWGSHLAALLTSSNNLDDVAVQDLANRTTPMGVHIGAVAGSRAGTQQPVNCTALLNKSVSRAYRGGKPKMFLPYGTDADIISPSQWSTGFRTALDNAWTAFIAALSGQTIGSITLGSEGAVSFYGPPTIPNTGRGRSKTVSTQRAVPLVQTVTGHSTSPIFGSQRRRLRP